MKIHKRFFNLFIFYASVFLLGFTSTDSFAKGFGNLYSAAELHKAQRIYEPNIRGILFEDINHYLTMSERHTLSTVTMNFSPLGHYSGLFEYSMNAQTGEMVITALAIKFFDELSIAFAWYDHQNKDASEVMKYIANLYANPGYLQKPLTALNVPEKIWEVNKSVDEAAQKLLKSAVTFLLLHELAHRHYRHAGYDAVSNKQSQKNEQQADAFALEVMSRMHVVPFGMVYWFSITAGLHSDEARTHPLSADRLYAIASRIEKSPDQFISQENRGKVSRSDILDVAKNIRTIVNILKN